jgi:hypothetical protein
MTLSQVSPRVAALLAETRATRGRLIFALDATMSRENMWDMAASLQARMFEEAAMVGTLDVQLVYYRGDDEVRKSEWVSDASELTRRMRTIRCAAGATQIAHVLRHVRAENERKRVDAAIFVGDAVEEHPRDLYAAAEGLGVPLFVFQEGTGLAAYPGQCGEPHSVESVLRELARLTNGAYGKFDAGAARQLGELLRAVAAFAVGGVAALANQRTDSARLLLGQIRERR